MCDFVEMLKQIKAGHCAARPGTKKYFFFDSTKLNPLREWSDLHPDLGAYFTFEDYASREWVFFNRADAQTLLAQGVRHI
jgi:hypothetical protein